MEIDKAQKIHELMTKLYEVEKFLKDLRITNSTPEVWLRAKDGSVVGVAKEDFDADYKVFGLREFLIDFYEGKRLKYIKMIEEIN